MATKPNQSTKQKKCSEHQLSLCGAPLQDCSPADTRCRHYCRRHKQQHKRTRLQRGPAARLRRTRAAVSSTALSQQGCSSFSKSKPSPSVSTEASASSPQALLQGVCKKAKHRQKPGKYVCRYCGRACAKPSVLQKHARSHTGEGPHTCAPCGFSFKTKSKQQKSHIQHTRAVPPAVGREHSPKTSKSGKLARGQMDLKESETMNSEGESSQHGCTSSAMEKEHEGKVLQETNTTPTTLARAAPATKDTQPTDGAHAVKQRLALRLSERMHAPVGLPDEATSFMESWNKGSTESGYFSHSESGEWSQASPPSTEAKSYAEIILGKFGRIDQRHRSPLQQWRASSDPVERRRSIPLNVPTTQVIEHITKLITINEALVDTKEIDSVKPRRSTLSRKSSTEVPKVSATKLPSMFHTKNEAPRTSTTSSVDLGCPREPLHPRFCTVDFLSGRPYPAPLVRSHSMPSPAGMAESPARRFRLSHSFDEQQALPVGKKVGRPHGILRRQPALEVSPEPEVSLQELTPHQSSIDTMVATPWQSQYGGPQEQEGKTYISGCRGKEGLQAHGSRLLIEHPPEALKKVVKEGVLLQRLQQEETKEHEVDLSKVQETASYITPTSTYTQSRKDSHAGDRLTKAHEVLQSHPGVRSSGKVISVIQHTSAFENNGKAFSVFSANKDRQTLTKDLAKPCSYSYQVHQLSIQVPRCGTDVKPCAVDSRTFQWPKRSSSLAQLPAEKLPLKKKCLRLAETAHFSSEPSLKSTQNNLGSSSTSFTSNFHTSYNRIPQADTESLVATVPKNSQMALPMTVLPRPQQTQTLPSSSSEVQATETWSASCSSAESSSCTRSTRRMCHLVKHPTNVAAVQEETSPCQIITAEISKAVVFQLCSPSADKALFAPKLSPSPESSTEARITEPSSNINSTCIPSEPLTEPSITPFTYKANSHSIEHSLSHCPVLSSLANQPAVTEGRLLVQPVLTFLSLKNLSGADAVLQSIPLKLQIPGESTQQKSKPLHCPSQDQIPIPRQYVPLPDICRPMDRLTVPVRTQTAIPKYGSALYTTRTQRTLKENCHNQRIACPSNNIQDCQLLPKSEEGRKHALSTADSPESGTKTDHQEKRAKMDEESNDNDEDSMNRDGHTDAGGVENKTITKPVLTGKWEEQEVGMEQEENGKEHRREPGKRTAETSDKEEGSQRITLNATSVDQNPYLCLHTATSVSWCLLQHPKFSSQRGMSTSVCPNECNSVPSLNPLGLSARVALSLLQSKQKQSAEVYTTATTPLPASSELLLARKPQTSEVAGKTPPPPPNFTAPNKGIFIERTKRNFREIWSRKWDTRGHGEDEGSSSSCTRADYTSHFLLRRAEHLDQEKPNFQCKALEDSENNNYDS